MNDQMTTQNSGDHNFKKMNPEQKIMDRSSLLRMPEGKTREEVLAELKEKIRKRESGADPSEEKQRLRIWPYVSVAAVIIILLGVWQLLHLTSETNVNAAPGSHVEYVLTDGSVVNLNAGSHITFNRKKFTSDRKLDLKGEAFFNVVRGSPFEVLTPTGQVMVLGTSFNVISRENIFKVTCFTGMVKVTSGNQSVTIGPDESAELTGGELKSYRESKMHYINGWINGEFYFENSPLNLVLSEIERQFNVKFVGREKESQDEFFTGSFFNKDLRAALEIVCIPMGLQYEINENRKISISGKKK